MQRETAAYFEKKYGYKRLEPIEKGWSSDKKYRAEDSGGAAYLLRITPAGKDANRREMFEMTERVAALGIPVGEWFGPDPANAPYGHGHDGWLLWCAMFLVSVVSGAVLERLAKKGVRLRSKKGAVWAAATALACIVVIVVILLTRPVMTGS